MIVRYATYHDVMPIAGLLEEAAMGKSTPKICRNRANTCVKRSILANTPAHTLVAVDDDGAVKGFIYAQEREAFDLTPSISFFEVPFLIGAGVGLMLLRELRRVTRRRIVITGWYMAGDEGAWKRFLVGEGFNPVATVFHS